MILSSQVEMFFEGLMCVYLAGINRGGRLAEV